MRFPELWRTTTFRLTVLYGAVFAVGVFALLGLVYWRTAGALTARGDRIIQGETAALRRAPVDDLPNQIRVQIANDLRRVNYYELFSSDLIPLEGNLANLPSTFPIDDRPHSLSLRGDTRPEARIRAYRLPDGEVLVVGRDVTELQQVRTIIFQTLLWSGATIVVAGLIAGTALSLSPLRRLRALQAASHDIVDGALNRRMPIAGRHDELDLFAGTVNLVLDEIERLMQEVKSVSDAIAHDLRTPLTRVRAALHRLGGEGDMPEPYAHDLAASTEDLDTVLERFAALLRISELEASERRAAFKAIDLEGVSRRLIELYQPLAEAEAISLKASLSPVAPIMADERLMFEALSNLIDNALKFTPPGGEVEIRLVQLAAGPRITIHDNGPGVPSDIRQLVLQRFYRGPHPGVIAGSGLGLSIVTAIVRLHRFKLDLADAHPGLDASLDCWSHVKL